MHTDRVRVQDESVKPSFSRRLLNHLSRVQSGGRFIPDIDGLRFAAIVPVIVFHWACYVHDKELLNGIAIPSAHLKMGASAYNCFSRSADLFSRCRLCGPVTHCASVDESPANDVPLDIRPSVRIHPPPPPKKVEDAPELKEPPACAPPLRGNPPRPRHRDSSQTVPTRFKLPV